jgi:hypothetical protein
MKNLLLALALMSAHAHAVTKQDCINAVGDIGTMYAYSVVCRGYNTTANNMATFTRLGCTRFLSLDEVRAGVAFKVSVLSNARYQDYYKACADAAMVQGDAASRLLNIK